MKLSYYIEKLRAEGLDVSVVRAGSKADLMKLPEVLDVISGKAEMPPCVQWVSVPEDPEITGLSCDSRTVTEGTLFVCKGAGFKQEYLDKALEAGAAAYVKGPDIRRAMAVLANAYNQDPWKDINLVGITGTKGKSTTLYYLKSIMEGSSACGEGKFAYLSTIDTYDGINFFESHLTTPESIELGERLANIRNSGMKAACMEVSSQALKYDRTYGVRFKYGVFTNFGMDHIGSTEHADEADYFGSKMMIFDQADNAVLGLENIKLKEVIKGAVKCRSITCYKAENARKVDGGTLLDALVWDGIPKEYENMLPEGSEAFIAKNCTVLKDIKLTMPGLFNAENAAAACAIALCLGASESEIRDGLLYARAAGRMEFFEDKKDKVIAISDYAHNELSYEKLMSSAKEEYPGYRLVAVFGCPGGKGHSRRVDLPKVAAKYADFTWVVEEDPADEDPMVISEEVLANLQRFGGKGAIKIDRNKAIEDAILQAEPETVVLVIGKGREEYQHRGNRYDPVESDSSMAERFIRLRSERK